MRRTRRVARRAGLEGLTIAFCLLALIGIAAGADPGRAGGAVFLVVIAAWCAGARVQRQHLEDMMAAAEKLLARQRAIARIRQHDRDN